MSEKTIGILGGMGPEATIDLYHRIIRATPVNSDQDHIKTIIFSNPKIPDRTNAILNNGKSPIPELVSSATMLKKAGADFLIMPCNTAHYFIDDLKKKIDIPIIHMINLTSKYIAEKYPMIKKIGLLATDGTIQSGIYNESLTNLGIHVLIPSNNKQKLVMNAIYNHIKTGELESGRLILKKVGKGLEKTGIGLIISGCTEISIVLKNEELDIPILDPMQILAEYSVNVALGKISLNNIQ